MDLVAAAGLLPNILNKLRNPREVVTFDAVCKGWHASSKVHCPTILQLERERWSESFCTGILNWAQKQVKSGRLSGLQKVTLSAPLEDLEPPGPEQTGKDSTLCHRRC